jgi:hypothetical protein
VEKIVSVEAMAVVTEDGAAEYLLSPQEDLIPIPRIDGWPVPVHKRTWRKPQRSGRMLDYFTHGPTAR